MNKKALREKKALTLIEILVTSSLVILVIGAVLVLNQFVQQNWQRARIKSHLVGQLGVAMELIKKEVDQTDATRIIGYPTAAVTYNAISFPLPVQEHDTNPAIPVGFVKLTNEPKIDWGQTVIYHIWPNPATGKDELKRTLFSPRNNTLTTGPGSQREAQLQDVVTYGVPTTQTSYAGTSGPAETWVAAGTRTLYTNDDISLVLTPNVGKFDGYSDPPARSQNIEFGSIQLASQGPGPNYEHVITFTSVDKNDDSTGYKLGIDCFNVAPGGFTREVEEATVVGTPTHGYTDEDMSVLGSAQWSANRQLEYLAAAPQSPTGPYDSISFYFNYDQLAETTFSSALSKDYVKSEYCRRTGAGTDGRGEAGNQNCVIRLDGCEDAWSAAAQTGAAGMTTPPLPFTQPNKDKFIRTIISGDKMTSNGGRAVKVTLSNNNPQQLYPVTIHCANIMQRDQSGGPNGVGYVHNLTFYDVTQDPMAVPHPVSPFTSITIPKLQSRDSDWIDMNDPTTADIENFESKNDYLLTLHVTQDAGVNNKMPCWLATDSSTQIYYIETTSDVAKTAQWSSPPPATSDRIYIAESIDTSYFSSGIFTSPVYDTGVDNPQYSTLSWHIAQNNYDANLAHPSADLIIRVRSSVSEAALLASTNWTVSTADVQVFSPQIDTLSATVPPGIIVISSLSTGNNKRYFQFQLEFSSRASSGKTDYLRSCILKDLTINWPGQTRMVAISGYFTERPDYGIFTVMVDGQNLLKSLSVSVTASEKISGSPMTDSLTVESKPRNTGK